MMVFLLSSVKIQAAELPAGLTPIVTPAGPNSFYCTDKPGAQKIAVCFRENADCHKQVGKNVGPDWVLIGLAVLLGGTIGYVVGNSSR